MTKEEKIIAEFIYEREYGIKPDAVKNIVAHMNVIAMNFFKWASHNSVFEYDHTTNNFVDNNGNWFEVWDVYDFWIKLVNE